MATINVGDRVKTKRELGYGRIPAGTLGTVVDKYVPCWATGCWSITVQFDGDVCKTGLPYPDGTIELIEAKGLPYTESMGYQTLNPIYDAACSFCACRRYHSAKQHDLAIEYSRTAVR